MSARQMSFTKLETGAYRADFGEGIEPFTFTPAAIPETVMPEALASGVVQNLRQSTSKLIGDARTPEALRAAILARWDRINSGVWTIEREAGEETQEFTIEEEAAHLYRVKRGEKTGEPYTGTLEDTAAAWEKVPTEKKLLLTGRSANKEKGLSAIKANALYELCYAEVKAQRAAARKAKLEKRAASAGDVDF